MSAFPNYQANLDRRAVSRALQAWRRDADCMSNAALAAAGGWSAAKMSMILNAVSPISEADLLTLAMILKAEPRQRELAYNSLQRARSPRKWDGGPCLGWGLDELEAEAIELRVVAGELLPALLQSQAYAGAVHAAQAAVLAEHRRPYSHELRQATLSRLGGVTPLRVHVVLGEAGLRRTVGGAQVMADQLLWLVQLCGMESVKVQVVPDVLGAFPGLGSAFNCLSFLERQFEDLVAIDLPHGTVWLEQRNRNVCPTSTRS
ncbi:DUF5753 domain-containing protein [Lentzea sp. NPDC004782]|uniref:DUF5753 domain-containing protein n=1 Tax=Lentzea sp. NPDC004782 TaxID=3154458 RepID=UPI0033BD9DF6